MILNLKKHSQLLANKPDQDILEKISRRNLTRELKIFVTIYSPSWRYAIIVPGSLSDTLSSTIPTYDILLYKYEKTFYKNKFNIYESRRKSTSSSRKSS